ncbi:hypothetical protein [Legionella longbeachae]|uniref:GLPGLI family protein n=1 Tax=Legionella longbeachae serogroup 1 (strain NSW150) TaxID=661367 RepID=D3HQB6_LEGLN|nr:hypothetical protein [Legionella longbeachae]VEE01601.1 Uncharacterised protein [Legionella oakridgensis]HBD7396362.1 hypothetical protein [Legionella pneumophila]ARB92053.1 hypothetical protein A6J40_07620 [Legionella longbeachae]ARM34764.1 hypothetical protein B0B39_15100 [Legionella longbeachae]EEZ95807.1 conserved hypothetical protein [Legionella longbeachae D-4968]
MRTGYQKCLIFALLILPTFSFAAQKSHLRGQRYCEILIEKSRTDFAVYNTIGLNNCPERMWDKITPAVVKSETGSSFVHLNGPRYWVIDGLKNSDLVNPEVKTFDGLKMREAGILHISFWDLFRTGASYKQLQVARHTTWVYDAGKPVYELIDPKGNVYVMQSYSVQKTPQTEQSLAQLGTKLKLPKKWQFKTGVLKKTGTVPAINNMAIVIQDDFLNTYQKASHDLLVENQSS